MIMGYIDLAVRVSMVLSQGHGGKVVNKGNELLFIALNRNRHCVLYWMARWQIMVASSPYVCIPTRVETICNHWDWERWKINSKPVIR